MDSKFQLSLFMRELFYIINDGQFSRESTPVVPG